MLDSKFEIAIVGAGMAGLTCAQLLHQAGYKVVVIDKSRGLGGRMATRRLHGTHADHGVCYLKPKSELFQKFLTDLVDRRISRVWTETIHEFVDGQIRSPQKQGACYVSATGISAIAKSLSRDLTLRLNHRVTEIREGWQLHCESGEVISAEAVVIAIPAPQAAELYEIEQVRSVRYSPCLTAIAVYPAEFQAESVALDWKGLICTDPELGWIGIDSTKQLNPVQPTVVVQSSAAFAERYWEELDLQKVGERLLERAAEVGLPWLMQPEILQVHRWRYAFPMQPLGEKFVVANSEQPLMFTGDWCGGNRVESAFEAGIATAQELNRRLENRSLSDRFW